MTPRLQNFTALPTEPWMDSFQVPEGALSDNFDLTTQTAVMTIGTDAYPPLATLTMGSGLYTSSHAGQYIDPNTGLYVSSTTAGAYQIPAGVLSFRVPLATVQSWPSGSYPYVLTSYEGGAPREICRGTVTVADGLRPKLQQLNFSGSTLIRISSSQSGDLRARWKVLNGHAPVDLTGYTVTFSVIPYFGHAGAPIASWVSQISRDQYGFLSLTVPQSVMATIDPGVWNCLMVASGSAGTYELARGAFEVLPGLAS